MDNQYLWGRQERHKGQLGLERRDNVTKLTCQDLFQKEW